MTTEVDSVPDAELMTAVTRGDAAALSVLYDRHAAVVYRTAFRRLGDRQTAEEVVQDVWLTLWERAGMFDPRQGSLAGWLMTIARNRATDRMRSLGRRPGALPLSAVLASDGDPDRVVTDRSVLAAGRVAGDPALMVDELALRETMTAALAALPADERTVLELGYYGELSQSEIAERLGIPLGTVKTRTRRALLRLRGAVAPSDDQPATSDQPLEEVPDGPR
ncbi:MAG: sigma-70 family RNA polymerase sigma factor [Chloroflexota bacterium]